MDTPIIYYYVALIGNEFGDLDVMPGQNLPDFAKVSEKYYFNHTKGKEAIYKVSISKNSNGIITVNVERGALYLPKKLIKRLILSKRLGFYDSARVESCPKITKKEFQTYLFSPDEYIHELPFSLCRSHEVYEYLEIIQTRMAEMFKFMLKRMDFSYIEAVEFSYTANSTFTHLDNIRKRLRQEDERKQKEAEIKRKEAQSERKDDEFEENF